MKKNIRSPLRILLFLLSFSPFSARAADGDSLWNVGFIHDIYFTFSQANYWDTLLNTHATDTYMQCDMMLDGRSLHSVGIKTKGNSSFNNPSNKKSFKIDLNEYVAGQDYDGIKKFNLNNGFKDPTMMREKICLDFLVSHGIDAPRCTYARVYLNGVYWGLYTLVEEVNSKFLKQHYPDNDGNLYKGDPSGDMKWYGSTASSYYSHYTLESDTNVTCWTDLVHLVDVVNNTPSSVYYDSLETVLNGWQFLYNMAAMNMFVNLDSYIGSGHNYFVYKDSTYFLFRWIAWDVNEAFGNFNLMMNVSQLQTLNYDYVNNPSNRPLATKMLADPTYHAMYISAYCDLMQDFSNTAMDPYIDSLANMIRADVYADTLKAYSNQQFEDNITMTVGQTPGLKSFISARRTSLTSQLSAYGCWLSTEEKETNAGYLSVFPNPAGSAATILLPQDWDATTTTVELFDATGRSVTGEIVSAKGNQLQLSVGQLADGIYFAVVKNAQGDIGRCSLAIRR
jgi:spore coat protein CotH